MPKVPKSPASPAIIGRRMYIITPSIVRIEGVKTPPKVPNFFDLAILYCFKALFC